MSDANLDGWVGRVQISISIAAVLFLVLPLMVIFPMAFSTSTRFEFPPPGYSMELFSRLLSSSEWLWSISYSLRVGFAAALLATVIGVPASYAIVRFRFPLRSTLYAVMLLPMVVPVIIVALSLLLAFAPFRLVGSMYALVIGHALLGLPFVVVMTTAVLRNFDMRLEHAARSLGASGLKAFWLVTLPGFASGIVVGAITAFATSFDEVVLAMVIGSPTVYTLPRQIWAGLQTQHDPVVPAVAVLLIVVVVTVFVIALTWAAISKRQGRGVPAGH
jgi:putative spermidine/putrescine transport system permease protein